METTTQTTTGSRSETDKVSTWKKALDLAQSGQDYTAIRELFKDEGQDFDETLEKIAPYMSKEEFFRRLVQSMGATKPDEVLAHVKAFKGNRKRRRANEAAEKRVVRKAHRRR